MLRSMTAFARQGAQGDWGELVWELRGVNQRFLEPNLRLPEELRALEPRIRERLAAHLRRGKVECNLRYRGQVTSGELTLNHLLAEQLIRLSQQVEALLPAAQSLSPLDILRWPGVIQSQETSLETVQQIALTTFQQALEELVMGREREGVRIGRFLEERILAMEAVLVRVRARLPEVLVCQRERLSQRLGELLASLNPDRLEQEMLLFAQRVDVAEELDRLAGHLEEVRRVLTQDEVAGRRLDFLMQELNREANTLGSKSVDTETTRAAVDLKVLIEQMREQVQNLE